MTLFRMQIIILASLALISCNRKKDAELPPSPTQKTFSFTETNTTVIASELERDKMADKALKADFNLDGLNDLAIIRSRGETQSEVDIYIQKQTNDTSSQTGMEKSYFLGGTIRRPDDGRIIGLVSSVQEKLVNIILLITYSNQPNEMIHYQNDGKSFTEVQF